MNKDDFLILASECGFDFDFMCSNLKISDIVEAEAFVEARLGQCSCSYCAIPYYVYLKTQQAPEEDGKSIENKVIEYLVSKGLYSYGCF